MPMKIGTKMPSLEGATGWLNWPAENGAPAAQGQPTLVHFWTVSCENGQGRIARIAALHERYSDEGLRVLAIHLPRFPIETNMETLGQVVAHLHLTEPCALDNRHKLRDAFQNERGTVPAYYLFDADGKLRCFAADENGLSIIASALEQFSELLLPRAKAAAAGQPITATQAFPRLSQPAAAMPHVLPSSPMPSPLAAKAQPDPPPLFCPSCDLALEADSRFCEFCGQAIAR